MKCPICGAKFKDNKCKYCVNVTAERVRGASNAEAKEQRKKGITDNIVYSGTLPSDVNKKKLVLLTLFLGWFGAHNFYVGKNVKAWFCLIPTTLLTIFSAITVLIPSVNLTTAMILLGFASAIVVMMWFTDLVNLLFKKFKVPVVLEGDFEQDFSSKN